jgi:hypothetical protein
MYMHIDEFTNLLKSWITATTETEKLAAFHSIKRMKYSHSQYIIGGVGDAAVPEMHREVGIGWLSTHLHRQEQVAAAKRLLGELISLKTEVNRVAAERRAAIANKHSAEKATKAKQLLTALNTAKSVKDLIDSGVILVSESNGFRGHSFSAQVAEEIIELDLTQLGNEWHIRHLTAPFGMVEVAKSYQKPHDSVTFYSGWVKNI